MSCPEITCSTSDPCGSGSYYRQRHITGQTNIGATVYVPNPPSPTPPSKEVGYFVYLGGRSSSLECDAGLWYYGGSSPGWEWAFNAPPLGEKVGAVSPLTDPNNQKYFELLFEITSSAGATYGELSVNGNLVHTRELSGWNADGSNVELKTVTSIAGFTGGAFSVTWTNVNCSGTTWKSEPAECNCCAATGQVSVSMEDDYYSYIVSLMS